MHKKGSNWMKLLIKIKKWLTNFTNEIMYEVSNDNRKEMWRK